MEEYKICGTCNQSKLKSLFYSKGDWTNKHCRECVNQKSRARWKLDIESESGQSARFLWAKNNKEKNSEASKKYYHANKEKCREKNKKFHGKNPESKRIYDRKWRAKKVREDPSFRLRDRIRRSIRRLLEKKQSRSLEYVGCQTTNEFYLILSGKTDNPNWIQDGYQIDHIWQTNWFSEFIERSTNDEIEVLMHLLHHHENLRPLEEIKNNLRSYFDIRSINIELYPKFKPFLNERIIRMIDRYIASLSEFNKELLPRGSNEEVEFVALFDDKPSL